MIVLLYSRMDLTLVKLYVFVINYVMLCYNKALIKVDIKYKFY
jgi:hypothetical protein